MGNAATSKKGDPAENGKKSNYVLDHIWDNLISKAKLKYTSNNLECQWTKRSMKIMEVDEYKLLHYLFLF